MISVREASDALLALVEPMGVETVALSQASGRVLARPVQATRNQPPFHASSMDGYAIKATEAERDAQFQVIGEAAAGHGFTGTVQAGQAVRIFTGAPIPEGADFVVIQEDVDQSGSMISIRQDPGTKDNIRPAGADFHAGQTIDAPLRLRPQDIALLAAMNIAAVPVATRPKVAIIATGDELVMPGETPGPDQIIASNTFGLQAMLRDLGAAPRLLPIARDTRASLEAAFDLAQGADLVVTVGGASVGDHDLVAGVAADLGMERAFFKIAMRPGKPLMAGRLRGMAMVGLPGNPVSAMVCGHVFVAPMIRTMLGLPAEPVVQTGTLGTPLGANGPREHYMRARLDAHGLHAFERQDSSLLSVLAAADALLIRPPDDPARAAGETVTYLPI